MKWWGFDMATNATVLKSILLDLHGASGQNRSGAFLNEHFAGVFVIEISSDGA